MDAYTSHVLLLWDMRFKSLEKSLKDLNRLPEGDRKKSALTLRNACLDALDQYSDSLHRLRTDFAKLQDELYEEKVDEIKFAPIPKKNWPYISPTEVRAWKTKLNKELVDRMLLTSANHEAKLIKHQSEITARLNKVFQKLQNQYGIPPKRMTRK